MKFATRRDLLERIEAEHAAFLALAESIPKARYRESGVWGEDWSVADLFAHLSEWHRMFLVWFEDGRAGRTPLMPAPGYKWNETPKLNRAIQKRFARHSVARLVAEFDVTHARVLSVVKSLSERDLLTPGRFEWTGKLPLASYVAPNTCSHYVAARKILARWLRGQKR